MTTASLRWPRALGPIRVAHAAAALGVLTVWMVCAVGLWFGLLQPPRAYLWRQVVLFAVPVGLAGTVILRRGRSPELKLLATAICATAAALAGGQLISERPYLAGVLPGLVAAGIAVRRWPGPAIVTAFVLSGCYGSLEAFTGASAGQVADILIAGLWLTLGGHLLIRSLPLRLTVGVTLLIVYLAITLLAVAAAADFDFALRDFRLTAWHMAVLIPIAYLSLPSDTREGCARAIAVACLLVGAYATLRWVIGPASQEQALLGGANGLLYNSLTADEQKVIGSFPNGQELGVWMAIVIPFLIARGLAWQGGYRIVALLAAPLCAIGLLGSGQRAGLIAALAGSAMVLIMNQLARSYRGPRLGIAAGAILVAAATAFVLFPAVVDTPEKVARYRNILTPSQDISYQNRLFKWRNAFEDIDGYPFGRGVGQSGPYAGSQRFLGNAADQVDNSYVKIAYDQGAAVMVLFMVALVVLLLELIRHAVWTRAPGEAAPAIAAAGTLTAMGIGYVANVHIASLASFAGWIIVGLGVATIASRPASGQPTA